MNVVGPELLAKPPHCRRGRGNGFRMITPPDGVGDSSCPSELGESKRFPVVSSKSDEAIIKVRFVFEEVDRDHIYTKVVSQEFDKFRGPNIGIERFGPAVAGFMN